MSAKDHVTGPAFLLVLGRTVGMIATFAIMPIFARTFSVEEVGTYRTFFIVFGTVFGLAQLGMAESLYYFLPRASAHIGRYVCNAAFTLAATGLACLAVLWVARDVIAGYFDNPALAGAIPLLGLFLTFMLIGAVLEIMMVSRKQHMSAALTYAISDFGRTALFILPALLLVSLRAVFIGAVIFAALRMTMMLAVLWREFGREFRPDLALWRTQLAYALPFALAVGVEAVLISYHQYVVGGRFDTATFAIYAMGCMSIPLMDLVVTSTTSVMMVKMAEVSASRDDALALFHDTVARLAFLLCPLTVALVILAEPFIITLYTDVYARSVPVFMVWALTIVPMMFAVDAVLRVYAQTRFLLVMNIIRFAVVASLIGWFIDSLSLVGAVLATLTALTAAKAAGVLRIAHVLRVPLARVLPWRTLARMTARAVVAAAPAWWLSQLLATTPWLALVAGGTAYAAAYAVLCYAPGVAEPAAIRLPILERARRLPVVGRALMARQKAAPRVALTAVGTRGER
jgi:O-antigen/teichoic acid export membrane protein